MTYFYKICNPIRVNVCRVVSKLGCEFEFLKGHVDQLLIWKQTPQKSVYWSHRDIDPSLLSLEDKQYLMGSARYNTREHM